MPPPLAPSKRVTKRLDEHETRLKRLETRLGENTTLTRTVGEKVDWVAQTVALLVPEVTNLRHDSMALKAVKKGGCWGALLALGGFIEAYWVDILRLGAKFLGH